MTRVYFHFREWEDLGMWRNVTRRERERFLPRAVAFTGDAKKYGRAMVRVLTAYPKACLHNLTDTGQNRRAWIGHAACFLATKCPEDITREAWAMLSRQQQDDANAEADAAIRKWEIAQDEKENCGIHRQMEISWILGWNTGRSAA